MKSDKLIHVKIDYEEGIESKRDILNAQASLIKILQSLKQYHLMRTEELAIKEKLKRKMSGAKTNIAKLNTNLPKIKIPKILEQEHLEEIFEKAPKHKKKEVKEAAKQIKHKEAQDELSMELEEIQDKLKRLAA